MAMAMVLGLALLLAGLSGFAPPANSGTPFAAGSTAVRFEPQQLQVEPAQLCTLQVMVAASAESLACMECFLAFDNSLLSFVSVEEGALFKSAPYPTLFLDSTNVARDTVWAIDCLLGYRSYFLPPGELVRFVFRAEQDGVAAVHIAAIYLWDIDRIPVYPVVDPDARIVIGTPSAARPGLRPGGSLTSRPNPFNPVTTLVLRLPADAAAGGAEVNVSVISPGGRLIRTLFSGRVHTEQADYVWDGRDDRGNRVASGVYFGVARTGSALYTTKLILIE